MSVVDKVVSSQSELEVYGHIPVTNHVEVCTSDRQGASAIGNGKIPAVPFECSFLLRYRLHGRRERVWRCLGSQQTTNGIVAMSRDKTQP